MSSALADTRRTVTTDGVALLHRTLAELCRADVPLTRALRVVEAEAESRALKDVARNMAADVEAGESLSSAYATHGRALPGFYARLVASGESMGDLPAALEQIADHATHRADVQARLRGALAYPLTAAVFVLLIGGGVLAFAAPKVWRFTEQSTQRSPWPVALATLIGLVVVIGVGLFIARRRGRELNSGWWIPVVGPLRRSAARASLASTLGLLLRRGMPLHAALREAADACPGEEMRSRVNAMAARAEGGAGLIDAVDAGGVFEPSLLWLVETGEQAGRAAAALDDVAHIQRERLARRLDRCTVLVRPAFELAVGAAVFAFAYAFVLPMFEFIRQLAAR